MALVVATGLIHPVNANWYFDNSIIGKTAEEQFELTIQRSLFYLRFQWNGETSIEAIGDEIQAIVESATDCLAFTLRRDLRVEVQTRSFINEGGNDFAFLGKQLMFEPDDPKQPMRAEPGEIAPLVLAAQQNVYLRLALGDVRTGLGSPADAAFHSYRAIESIRQAFVVGDPENAGVRRQSWDRMRDVLALERAPIDVVRDAAAARRHGGLGTPDRKLAQDCITIAQDVVRAFVSHVRNNSQTGK